ncbi:MAG: hypothetical protein DDG60_06120 [Anaerolineae bacterium]|nr:MAG: hypothetical protein DDG60_06120 [Anaerolineae bacterium]
MKELIILLAVLALLTSNLACRTLLPETSDSDEAQSRQYEAVCQESVSGVRALRENLEFPQHFLKPHPSKQGGEFDPNAYFDVLTRLKMQDGWTLDYVYYQDGFGGLPMLYARPLDQPPYPTDIEYYAANPPNFLASVVVEDSPEGYLQFAFLSLTADQFYLHWHARSKDWQLLCGASDIERVINEHQGQNYDKEMTPAQIAKARAIEHPAPEIELRADRAILRLLIFSNWKGFVRRTYTISRAFPHEILDAKDQTLVEYNWGIIY